MTPILVPNTTTFNLLNVKAAIQWHSPVIVNDLVACFSNSIAQFFDPTYGSKTMNPQTMYGFRNYGPKYSDTLSIYYNDNPWVAPAGCNFVVALCYGGGAASGLGDANGGGGGGGGGGFIMGSYAVTAGNSYTLAVGDQSMGSPNGDNGMVTTFNFNSGQYIKALGGYGGLSYANGATGGNGRGSMKSLGITPLLTHIGGNGVNGTTTYGGGGGGGAGDTGNGNNASGTTGGAYKTYGGGQGGYGATTATYGGAGYTWGGASGGSRITTRKFTYGAAGIIIIYY